MHYSPYLRAAASQLASRATPQKATGLKHGAAILAVDNHSPVSRVAVYVRAGSRYEPDHLPGISHYIRACAGLTTQDSSIFGITRHMEKAGASFRVSSDREFIVYNVDCLRDKLGYVLGFIDDTLHRPEFRSWELVDVVQPRLKEELGRYKKNQGLIANEAMHKAAYRGGLAHSVFAPEHQADKIKKSDVFEYFEKNFVLDRMSFVGLGVDEAEFKETIDDKFRLNPSEYQGVKGDTRYVGGEARIQANFPVTKVNFVVQGSPITDLKSLAALEVLSFLIGGNGQTPIKYGSGSQRTLTNIVKSFSSSHQTSVININHSDTGLFGFSVCGPNETLKEATKACVKHVKQILNGVSENDLKNAKSAAKARLLIESEDQEAVFNAMGRRHATGITGMSPLDLVEKLHLKDVQSVASNLLKSKPTLVAVGNPRYVPYVDELD
uniref:Cytochrome b-c1 complex subunit 2, mitochondrial n=1 Tax=Aceria tosichella TaxID=561515 RepID=A0A6G1SLA9_9ACAR